MDTLLVPITHSKHQQQKSRQNRNKKKLQRTVCTVITKPAIIRDTHCSILIFHLLTNGSNRVINRYRHLTHHHNEFQFIGLDPQAHTHTHISTRTGTYYVDMCHHQYPSPVAIECITTKIYLSNQTHLLYLVSSLSHSLSLPLHSI